MNRIRSVDWFRGLFLVGDDDRPYYVGRSSVSRRQSLGYVSAAEGFVFLSGLVAGFVYPRRGGPLSELGKRCVRPGGDFVCISACHVRGPAVRGSSFRDGEAGQPVVRVRQAVIGWTLIATLLFQPGMFGILPAYIIFILLVPVLTAALRRGQDRWLLAASFGVWVIGQFGLGQMLWSRVLPNEPGLITTRFELLPWQFMFIIGFWLGYRVVYERSVEIPKRWYLTVAALAIAVPGFLYRHEIIFAGSREIRVLQSCDAGGNNLGLIRLVDFLALAYLAKLLVDRFGWFFRNAWMELLGQHSLQVFCYHILASYGQRIVRKKLMIESDAGLILLTALVVATLTIPAILHGQFRLLARKRRSPSAPERAERGS